MPEKTKNYISLKQAAEIIGLGPRAVVKMTKDGRIQGAYRKSASKFSRLFVPAEEVERIRDFREKVLW